MVKSRVIVEDGQSLFDVSIMLFGHQDGIFSLIDDNPDVDLTTLTAGQLLYYTPAVLDKATLELYTKRNYKPATSDDMNYAPIPPAPPSTNAVIIHLYGLDDVSVDAPGEFTVPPSVVEFDSGDPSVNLSPGETLTIPACPTIENVIIKDSAGNTMYTLVPGTTQVLPDISARNSVSEIIGTAIASHVIPVADITVTQADGSTNPKPAGQNVICEFPELELRNTAGDLLETISSYPSGGIVEAWNATVLRDGAAYGTVKSGGTINVISAGVTPSGILYKRPLIEQKASYINYDFGYYVQNGDLAFNTPANPAFIQDLDIADTNWFYRLKFDNVFGSKYRFTNSVGIPATDGLAGFTPSDYVSGGGTDLYVIDHLTGFGYYVANLGSFTTWTDAINAVRTNNPSFLGMSGWMPMYRAQVVGLFRVSAQYYNTANILKRGVVSGYSETQFWTGETAEQSSTNGFAYNDSNNLRTFAKTSTTMTIYMWRKHY